MPTVEHAGARLHYEVHGSGERTIVFAHGRGGNAASWWRQIPYFAPRYRVVTFDHRGFGRSRCDATEFDVTRFGGDLAAVLDAARAPRAALVCQSMGGWSGLQLALADPGRVWALVLSCTPAGIDLPSVRAASAARAAAARGEGGTGAANPALADDFPDREPELAVLYEQIRTFNTGPGPTGLHGPSRDAAWVDPARLARLAVPVLAIAAAGDRIFPPEVIADAAACIPGAELRVLEHVGHSPYYEDPEAFNGLVEAFLARQAAS